MRVGVCEKKWLKKSVCKSDHGEIVKEIGLERREDGEIVREMCVFVFCKSKNNSTFLSRLLFS